MSAQQPRDDDCFRDKNHGGVYYYPTSGVWHFWKHFLCVLCGGSESAYVRVGGRYPNICRLCRDPRPVPKHEAEKEADAQPPSKRQKR